MKLTPSASAALVAVILGLGGIAAPAALAQDSGPRAAPDGAPRAMTMEHGGKRLYLQREGQRHMQRGHAGMQRHMVRGGSHRLLALSCSPRGADRLEHVLLSLSQRLDPTAEQQPLFKEFRTAALTAQTGFADACADLHPARNEADSANLVQRLQDHVALDEARIAAVQSVLPPLENFYDSLTNEQKAMLEPRRGARERGDRGERSLRLQRTPAPGN
jgi:hypothetical protein